MTVVPDPALAPTRPTARQSARDRAVVEPRPPRGHAVTAYSELSLTIRAAGLLRRRYGYYWSWLIGLPACYVTTWVLVVLVGDSWWQLVLAAVMAVLLTQFGFLGHDAAHRQIFASAAWNEWTSRLLSAAFTGLSYGWWMHKHNRHHGRPNTEGRDPDISSGVLAFTPAIAATRRGAFLWFTRCQGYLFFPLLLLEGVNLHVASLLSLVRRSDLRHRRTELALVTLRWVAYFGVLFLVLPPGKAVAFLAVQVGLFGLLLGGSFAPNHKGMPIVPADAKVDFLRRQVVMSRNVTGGPFTDLAMGGLNYQIEHHLFPSMPRPNLRRAQPLVLQFCEQKRVPYTQMSLGRSYGTVVRYLNAVGLRARDPFTCPLVQLYRGS
jgi:fatty acid desaturase